MINQKSSTGSSLQYLRGNPQSSSNIQYNATFAGTPTSDLGYYGGQPPTGDAEYQAQNLALTQKLQSEALGAQELAESQRAQYCKQNKNVRGTMCPENKKKLPGWAKFLADAAGGVAGFVMGGPVGAAAGYLATDAFADDLYNDLS